MSGPSRVLPCVDTARRHHLGGVDLAVVNVVVAVADPSAGDHVTHQTPKVCGGGAADGDVARVVGVHNLAAIDAATLTHIAKQTSHVAGARGRYIAVDIGIGDIAGVKDITNQAAHVIAGSADAWTIDGAIGDGGVVSHSRNAAHILADAAGTCAADGGAIHQRVGGREVIGIAGQATYVRTWARH